MFLGNLSGKYLETKSFIKSDFFLMNFFYILYFIIIKLIFLNLFVVIIYSTYAKIKPQTIFKEENFSWFKVIFFCCYKKKLIGINMSKETLVREIDQFYKNQDIKIEVNIKKNSQLKNLLHLELEKIKIYKSEIFWIDNSYQQMLISFLSKESDEDLINNSNYKNIDEDSLKYHFFIHLSFKLKLLNILNLSILDVKENSDKNKKLINYYLNEDMRDERNFKLRKKEKKTIEFMKKKFMLLVDDIENIREINIKLRNAVDSNDELLDNDQYDYE